jgi:DNA-directed RNA polymerase specialized sigma24 family protein
LPDQLDLPDLFRRCQRKEEAACEAIYRWVSRMAVGILARTFSNLSRVEQEEAADRARYRIVEAMMHEKIDAVNATTNWPLIGYVKRVIENAAKDVARQRRDVDGSDQVEGCPASGPSPVQYAIARETAACAERVLNSLEASHRRVFVLKWNGVPTRTVAEEVWRMYGTVLSTQAIDTRYSRLLAKIQRECDES